MRTQRDRISRLLGVLSVLPLWASLCLGAQDPVVVKTTRGPVEIRRSKSKVNRWYALRAGSAIKSGDEIRTGRSGRLVLKLDDGSKMILNAESRLQILESAPNRLFKLAVGRVRSFVKKVKPTNKFEVRTPLAAASVRGTVFEVGFDEQKNQGYLDVSKGLVNLKQGDQEVDVGGGQRVDFLQDRPFGAPGKSQGGGGEGWEEDESSEKDQAKREVGLGMSKEAVMAAAAEEMRLAEYQEGKTLLDVNGDRVRLEEYIIRNPKDTFVGANGDRAFKLVVLNERESRFDYFYYLGMFNTTLPEDLSEALNEVRGKLGATAPTYYLDSYQMGMSNTQDSVLDEATGGHLVQITYDGTNYYLTDPDDPTNTRTIAAEEVLTSGGDTFYKIYDPVADKFVTITEAQYLAGGGATAVYDASADVFRSIGTSDTYWRTAYNTYEHSINGNVKQSYTPSSSLAVSKILALDTDASFSFAGGSVFAVTDTPSGSDALHNRVRLFYGDGTMETVNTYIISDDGKIGPTSAFDGLTSGAAYKDELLKWNYEQVYEASEFEGRKIDLVVEPKILIKSGLIQ